MKAPFGKIDEQKAIRTIERETIGRYSDRYAAHGVSHKTLGWGSREQQAYRFDRVLECADFSGKTVLDVGCGFGDLLGHFRAKDMALGGYVGTDINPDLIGEARIRSPETRFECLSLMDLEPADFACDIVVMLGLLNFKQALLPNARYAQAMLAKAFSLCRDACIVDFLSDRAVDDYPKEDFVHYYDPRDVLGWALRLAPDASLRHDYRPIPQREMMLAIRRGPCA